MQYLNDLKTMDAQSVRSFIKENEFNEDFINEMLSRKEEILPILASAKALRDSLLLRFESKEDAKFICSLLVEYNFTPGITFFEHLIRGNLLSEGEFTALVDTFHTVPFSVSFLMSVMNHGMLNLGVSLLHKRKELQTNKVAALFIEVCNGLPLIQDMILSDEVTRKKMVSLINSDKGNFADELVDRMIREYGEDIQNPALAKYKLSTESYKIMAEKINKSHNNYSYRTTVITAKWSSDLEEFEPLDSLKHIHVIDAPVGSRFRRDFVLGRPSAGTDEELLSFFKNGVFSPGEIRTTLSRSDHYQKMGVLSEILSRPQVALSADIEAIQKICWPRLFADKIGSLSDEVKYDLYMRSTPAHKRAIRPKINKDYFASRSSKGGKKRSYFAEVMQAIKHSELEKFREYLSTGYTVEKFAEDTHQTSKRSAVDNISLSGGFLSFLTKEEFLALCKSRIRFVPNNLIQRRFGFTLTADEAYEVHKKNRELATYLCNDFISMASKMDINEIVYAMQIPPVDVSDKEMREVAKILIEKTSTQSNKTAIYSGTFNAIARHFTNKEVQQIFNPMISDLKPSTIEARGFDGEYVLSDDQLAEITSKNYYILKDGAAVFSLVKRNPEIIQKILLIASNLGSLGQSPNDEISIEKLPEEIKSVIKKATSQVTNDPEEAIDSIFENGGNWDDFYHGYLGWREALAKYHKNRTIKIPSLDRYGKSYDLVVFAKFTPGFTIETNRVHLGSDDGAEFNNIAERLRFREIEIGYIANHNQQRITDFLGRVNTEAAILAADGPTHLSLLAKGFTFANTDAEMANFIRGIQIFVSSATTPEMLQQLENYGLIYDNKTVEAILKNCSNTSTIDYLGSRLGGLESWVLSTSRFYSHDYGPGKIVEVLKKHGVKIASPRECQLHAIYETLKSAGKDFGTLSLDDLDSKEKISIISFIEKEVDPRFKSLNLLSTNLEQLKELSSYENMRYAFGLDAAELAALFAVPNSLISNKKLMSGIRDLATIDVQTVRKISLLKRVIALIADGELSMDDLLQHDKNHDNLQESDGLKEISMEKLNLIISSGGMIGQRGFLKNMEKSAALRFLRTAKDHNIFRDIFSMANEILNGIKALEFRYENMLSSGAPQQSLDDLKKTTESIVRRFQEVCTMDNATHMHDRLVPLGAFIQGDPLQPLGQDKFHKLEKSSEVPEALGFKLYFPKIRGDLQVLGELHGWCVKSNKSYGDNLLSKGNILVAIVPEDKEVDPVNVVALAHYLHDGRGNYNLEQLKWSSKTQKGRQNVDATNSFDHKAIRELIIQYISKLEAKMASESQSKVA